MHPVAPPVHPLASPYRCVALVARPSVRGPSSVPPIRLPPRRRGRVTPWAAPHARKSSSRPPTHLQSRPASRQRQGQTTYNPPSARGALALAYGGPYGLQRKSYGRLGPPRSAAVEPLSGVPTSSDVGWFHCSCPLFPLLLTHPSRCAQPCLDGAAHLDGGAHRAAEAAVATRPVEALTVLRPRRQRHHARRPAEVR